MSKKFIIECELVLLEHNVWTLNWKIGLYDQHFVIFKALHKKLKIAMETGSLVESPFPVFILIKHLK